MTTNIGRVFQSCKKLDGAEFGWDDYDALPVQSRRFLAQYGWKQWMADAHASDSRDKFPVGAAGTEMWKDSTRTHIMERHTVITTGVGLPGEPKPDVAKELARALERIAELEAQAAVARNTKRAA